MKILRNGLGAFGDAAILFPILVLLSSKSGAPMDLLLGYTGALYIFSALFYRIPMPVQPLKSIAMAAVSLGATFTEIRTAGLGVGALCLLLLLLASKLESWLTKVPVLLIHQLQVGLGVLLIMHAIKALGWPSFLGVEGLIVGILVLGLILKPEILGVPALGVVATGAFLFGLAGSNGPFKTELTSEAPIRWYLVATLILPQIALTLGNSVLSTKNISDRLYPERRAHVSYRRLLGVIGIGNLLMGLWGGLPFCHGSGGLTAHQKAGATHWGATAFMGLVLLIVAFLITQGRGVIIPPLLLSILLGTVGYYHVKLAQPSWGDGWAKLNLILAAMAVLLTQNLLLVFPVFFAIVLLKRMEAHYGFLS
jgi:hypothetical protein